MFGEPWGSCVLHIFAAIWALVVAFSWQHRPYSPWLVNCSYASPAACCLVCWAVRWSRTKSGIGLVDLPPALCVCVLARTFNCIDCAVTVLAPACACLQV
jgi:hypothetical protein